MDDAPRSPSVAAHVLAALAGSRLTRPAVTAWWVFMGVVTALAYLGTVSQAGAMALVAGALFVAGLVVVAVVARNASAEARRPGTVRRGSIVRAAALGVVVHGGLVAAATIFEQSALPMTFVTMLGAWLVAMTRPTTLAAMGIEAPQPAADVGAPAPAVRPEAMSTPALVGALRASAAQVRATTDPTRKAELAAERGVMIEVLADRDPQALVLLLDESSVHPTLGDGPDGSATTG